MLDFVKNSPETLKGMKTPVAELGVKVGGARVFCRVAFDTI